MSIIEMFMISFIASFLGSFAAIGITLYLHKKQVKELKKLKKSIQNTISRKFKKK